MTTILLVLLAITLEIVSNFIFHLAMTWVTYEKYTHTWLFNYINDIVWCM